MSSSIFAGATLQQEISQIDVDKKRTGIEADGLSQQSLRTREIRCFRVDPFNGLGIDDLREKASASAVTAEDEQVSESGQVGTTAL